MATVSTPHLLTAEEYGQLDEVLGFRDELIEGERVLSPSTKAKHTLMLDHLTDLLREHLRELSSNERLRIAREAGWKFRIKGIDSVPEPDLMIVTDADMKDAAKADSWFEGVPLLVIEVISPSERRMRRMQKVGLYLEMGVPCVIEADYTRRVVLVYTPDADAPAVYRAGDHITSPFRAAVNDIFSVLN